MTDQEEQDETLSMESIHHEEDERKVPNVEEQGRNQTISSSSNAPRPPPPIALTPDTSPVLLQRPVLQTTQSLTQANSLQLPSETQSPSSYTFQDGLHDLEERIGKPSRQALHNFFYTQEEEEQQQTSTSTSNTVPQQVRDINGNIEQVRDFNTADNNNTTENNNSNNTNNNNEDPLQSPTHQQHLDYLALQEEEDQKFVANFWKWYDDIVILSLFGFLGIVFRIMAAHWFAYFDSVFNSESALFKNLPLNCLSCFVLGMLGSGKDLLEIINTRKTTPNEMELDEMQQHPSHDETEDEDEEQQQQQTSSFQLDSPTTYASSFRGGGTFGVFRTRRRRNAGIVEQPYFSGWMPPVDAPAEREDEMRQVQLQALERRIKASPCLLLFPVKKQEMDVMEHYINNNNTTTTTTTNGGSSQESQHQQQQHANRDGSIPIPVHSRATSGDSIPTVHSAVEDEEAQEPQQEPLPSPPLTNTTTPTPRRRVTIRGHAPVPESSPQIREASENPTSPDHQQQGLDQLFHGMSANIHDVSTNITTNFSRFNRVNVADGWDNGTSARAMSDDLLLGLRIGFCGALSSFTSWNSTMISLLRGGHVGEAIVGYVIGLQLPIVAYRFGQHVAVYVFVWQCRRETRRDERRGYGLRVRLDDDSDEEEQDIEEEEEEGEFHENGVSSSSPRSKPPDSQQQEQDALQDRNTPSVRAIATAIFVLAIVMQITSISFFNDPQQQQIAIGLLFSPFGVLARWKLAKFNHVRPGFPLGTFLCNMLACALSGSLGSLLAGNPGPEESIVLVAMISGFAGSLSSLSQFVVEILAGIDPLIFKYSGLTYAIWTITWGFVIGLVTRASMDWADQIGTPSITETTTTPTMAPTMMPSFLTFMPTLGPTHG